MREGEGLMRLLLIRYVRVRRGVVALADTELRRRWWRRRCCRGGRSSERLVPAVRRLMEARGWRLSELDGGGGGAWAGVVYGGAGGVECGEGIERGGGSAADCGVAAGFAGGCVVRVTDWFMRCWMLGGGSFITGSMWGGDVCGRLC